MDEDEATAPEAEPVIPGLLKSGSGEVPAVNERHDAPTIYVDAVQGAMVSPTLAKISFIEHFLDGGVNGRYVLNLAMPAQQLKPIGELLIRVATELEQAVAQGTITDG